MIDNKERTIYAIVHKNSVQSELPSEKAYLVNHEIQRIESKTPYKDISFTSLILLVIFQLISQNLKMGCLSGC